MKKSAFTLAEVLITLTIIGMVMAIVIPVVVNSVSDTSGLQYKKVITDLQNAIDMAKEDTNSYIAPLNYSQVTHFAGVSPANFCTMVSNQFTTVGDVRCSEDTSTTDKKPSFMQINGVAYWNIGGTGTYTFKNGSTDCTAVPGHYSNACVRTVWIDINGDKKGKNEHGKDRFKLLIRYDGKVFIGTGEDWVKENTAIEDSTF